MAEVPLPTLTEKPCAGCTKTCGWRPDDRWDPCYMAALADARDAVKAAALGSDRG